jgi:chromosomal replication initiation ATPase DnaA
MAQKTRRISLHENDIRRNKMYRIAKEVEEYFNTSDIINSRSRLIEIREPRQIAMYFCYEKTDFTWQTIADFFNGKNHATVIHAHNKIEGFCDTNKAFKATIEELEIRVNNVVDLVVDKVKNTFNLIDGRSIITIGFTEEQIKQFKFLNDL